MNRSLCLTVLAAGLATSAAHAQTAILQGINPAAASAAVPGISDALLGGTLDWTGMAVSPDGSRWVINAFLNAPSGVDELLLAGTGIDGSTTQVVVREGDDASSLSAGEVFQTLDPFPRINDSGTVAFAGDFASDLNLDDFIATWNAGSYTLIAREGGDASLIIDVGALWDTLDSPVIDNSGTVGFRATSIDNVDASTDAAIVFGNAVLAQENITLIGGALEVWQLFDLEDFWVSADGTDWLIQGDSDLATTQDDIVVVTDTVVQREGTTLGGLPADATFAAQVFLSHSGDYMVRGAMTGGDDYVNFNGTVVAVTDGPTGLSTGELWDDAPFGATYFTMCSNNLGDYIVGGLTNLGDLTSDAVLVLNGTTEALRENDPVDVDGNGLFDDNAFIDIFHNDDVVLTDDLIVYALVTLQDSAGVEIGEAFIYKNLAATPPCTGDIADDFGTMGSDGQVSFGDFLALLGLIGPCPGGNPGCTGDIADDFGTLGGDGQVSFGDFLALLGLIGPCP